MNQAKIINSVNDAKDILSKLDLLETINKTRQFTLSSSKFSEEFYQVSQKDDYRKIYKIAMENSDYDFLLKDGSFIQFSIDEPPEGLEKGKIRYAYYQSPFKVKSYEEFLQEQGFSYDECKDEFREYYEISIDEAELNQGICPIRYDYDYKLYDKIYYGLKHSISHLHIGHNNEVRITLSKILVPEKFIIFIIRNWYPCIWKKIVDENDAIIINLLNSKSKCLNVKNEYFSEREKKLLYMV